MSRRQPSPVAVTALALAALVGAFGAGAAWSDPSGDRAGTTARALVAAAPGPAPAAPAPTGPGSLRPADSCAELLDRFVERTLPMVSGWGWDGGPWFRGRLVGDDFLAADRTTVFFQSAMDARGFAARDVELSAEVPATGSSATGTNVQEVGIDEPDVAKTDGQLLVRIDGDELTTYDLSGQEPRELARLGVGRSRGVGDHELLLAGDTVLVIGAGHDPGRNAMSTTVQHVDVSDPAAPVLGGEQVYGGDLLSARLHDGVLRLAVSTGLPELDFVRPGKGRTRAEALRHNRQEVRESTIEDWLPTVHGDGVSGGLLADCEDVHVPREFSGAGAVVLAGHPVDEPADRSAVGVAATASTVYTSTDRVYLATMPSWGWCCVNLGPRRSAAPVQDDGSTDLHAFAIDGVDATYVASGQVEGTVADRWAMDSVDGVLRVAVGPSSETGNHNAVVTMAERDGRLVEIGRVGRLGVNEDIHSVRWLDDLAIVVTFRQIDPLYVIDLADPVRPRLLGELKIPGFSDYLHPIGDDRLLGLGEDASLRGVTRGGQAAVFDIADLRDPQRLSTLAYDRNEVFGAAEDPRQFSWLPDRGIGLAVVQQWGRGGEYGSVSVLRVDDDGELSQRMVRAVDGWRDIQGLRTLPLPDGRVVMTSDDDTRFLDLDPAPR